VGTHLTSAVRALILERLAECFAADHISQPPNVGRIRGSGSEDWTLKVWEGTSESPWGRSLSKAWLVRKSARTFTALPHLLNRILRIP
jgi:hypothetical protein